MPSPFPGMDPFLEARWGGAHTTMIVHARRQLQSQLPEGLLADIEEYFAIQIDDETRHYRPDVAVVQTEGSSASQAGTAVLDAPEVAVPFIAIDEPETMHRIRINSIEDDRLVTSIEILSPSNKESELARERFRRKQINLLGGGANLVEIDLLISGGWTVFVRDDRIPPDYRTPYRICVVRADAPWAPEAYKAPLESRLPVIRIPLRKHDPDIHLDLQLLVDAAWEDGAYGRLDYSRAPCPRLPLKEESWMLALLAERGVQRSLSPTTPS